jgi:hypothetical protein
MIGDEQDKLSIKDKMFIHSRTRLAMRYKMELTQELHDAIVDKLKSDKSPGFKKTCRRYLSKVRVDDQILYLVWDRKREVIVTILTYDMYLETVSRGQPNKKKRARMLERYRLKLTCEAAGR